MNPSKVLLVEDDRDVREAIGQSLELVGFGVILTRALIEATDHISAGFAGVVVTDIRMPGKDGFDVLARVAKIDPELPVIVLTGEGDVPMAVRAMAEGAYDFLEKPCPPKRLIEVVSRAWTARSLVLENRRLRGGRQAARAAVGASLNAQMEMVERLLIEEALTAHQGRVVDVAEALALPRKTLYDKLKRHDIDPAAFRYRE